MSCELQGFVGTASGVELVRESAETLPCTALVTSHIIV